MACRHLFEEKYQRALDMALLANVQRALYQELLPHFERTWEDLDEEEQKWLAAEILRPTQSRPSHLELSESALFCRMICKISQSEPVEILVEDIKGALDHLDDSDFLTTSPLGSLQCISLQARTDEAVSLNRQGRLVRELLKKAFEQLKPGDTRNDTALEWRLYNILWYHYFKYNLPNHNTAARLSISLRQFYREQDKAIEALRKEVLAIEEMTLQLGE